MQGRARRTSFGSTAQGSECRYGGGWDWGGTTATDELETGRIHRLGGWGSGDGGPSFET